MDGPVTVVSAPTGRRPFGILVLAGLLVLKAVLLLLVLGGAFLPDAGPLRRLIALPTAIFESLSETPLAGVLILLVVAALLASTFGLLGRRRWGWLAAMVTTGFFLATDIYTYGQGTENHLWMALNVVTVLYLNQTDVRTAVGLSQDRSSGGVPSP